MLYNNCNDELRNVFERKYGVPVLYKDGIGQFNENGELVEEFRCKQYAVEELQISHRTLRKAMEKNIPYNGFFYRSLQNKIKII